MGLSNLGLGACHDAESQWPNGVTVTFHGCCRQAVLTNKPTGPGLTTYKGQQLGVARGLSGARGMYLCTVNDP